MEHLLTILRVISLLLAMSFLGSADSIEKEDTVETKPDIEHLSDKEDWVDHGDMFSFDPSTKSNREPRFKNVVSMVMMKKKEERKIISDEENGYSSDQESWRYAECENIKRKYALCEAHLQAIHNRPSNDHCGKTSYMMIRRLMLLLSKLIRTQHFEGSVLKLSVNLDELHFEMPADVQNLSNCDFLANINAIADQILPSIVIALPDKPYDYANILKYTALAAAAFWSLVRMSLKMRIWSLLIVFFLVVYVWEFISQYHREVAKVVAVSSRLSYKCTSPSETTWFRWISPLLPKMSFARLESECDEYFIATRVNPLLSVNPIRIFFDLYEKSFLYGFKKTANVFGASVATFFSHIPLLAFPFILVAFVAIIVFALKYFFKYSSKPQKTNKNIGRKKKIKPLNQSSSRLKGISKPAPRINQRNAEVLMTRCKSTGDIPALSLWPIEKNE